MGNALWLFFAVPDWYFSSFANPLSAGPLSLIPALGTFCLLVGITIGVVQRRSRLLLWLIPFALSQALVTIAGALRGQVGGPAANTALLIFIATQFLVGTYLVYSLKGVRVPAVALAIFSITYAMHAAFVAGMALSDQWL